MSASRLHRPAPDEAPETEREKAEVDWRLPLAVVAVVLFGAFLRTVRLHSAPPGLFFDEAANLFDIKAVLGGWHPLYFPANNGREPFFFYWASLFASIWGVNSFALRLAAAIIGTLTLVTTFFCARETFRLWDKPGRWADWSAVAATFVLATSYAHLHFSRFGLRTISLPLFLSLSYALFLLAMRRRSWWAYAGAGLVGGLSIYTYISSRIAPALLAVPLVAAPRRARQFLPPILLVAALWIVACIPLGVYYLRHPADVEGHTDDVSMLNPANNHGDLVGALLHGAVSTFAAIDVHGSDGGEQNLPGRPLLDPIQSAFLFIGLAALVWGCFASAQSDPDRQDETTGAVGRGNVPRRAFGDASAAGQRHGATPSSPSPGGEGCGEGELTPYDAPSVGAPARPHPTPLPRARGLTDRQLDHSGLSRLEARRIVALFLIAWIVNQLIPPIFSVNPPSYIRLTGMFPALAIVVGLGIGVAVRIATRRIRTSLVRGALAVALIGSTAWTVRDYFVVWAPGPVAYAWMMGHKVDSANRLNLLARTDRVFLAPLYFQDYTIRYLTQGSPIQSFDLGLSLVVPTDRSQGVHYVFPADEQDAVSSVLAALPVRPSVVQIYDPTGRFHILTELDLAASQVPGPPAEQLATFDGRIALVGRNIPLDGSAGQSLPITLEWQALKPSPEDDTIFLHLRDGANKTVAQTDRQPTNGTDPTSQWHAGDLVWDRITLALPANLPPGKYRLVGGFYRLADQKRLPAFVPTGRADSDEVTLAEITIR